MIPLRSGHPSRLLVLALVLAPTACVVQFGGEAKFRDTRIVTEPHVPGSALEVRTSNGSVEVGRGDVPEVRVTARLRARTEDRLRRTRIVTGRRDDGTLLVEVRWPGDVRYGDEGCGFEIVLPDARGLLVRSANGTIAVTGIGGDAELGTSNGAIAVKDQDGNVRATTSNGGVRLERITGQAVVRSSNGAIEVLDVGGPVEADTSNGKIAVRLTDACSGPIRAQTTNGAIRLDLGPGFRGEIRADTSNGSIGLDAPRGVQVLTRSRNSARIAIGGSSPLSVAETSNGEITIQVR